MTLILSFCSQTPSRKIKVCLVYLLVVVVVVFLTCQLVHLFNIGIIFSFVHLKHILP